MSIVTPSERRRRSRTQALQAFRSRASALRLRLVAALLLATSLAFSDVDKEALREQFREGLAAYEAGNIEAALAIWKPIYERLGRAEGYRLAYNIAKAEVSRGDARAAATWYAAYLTAVDARRQRGEPIETGILGQEVEARDRLASLSRELVRFEAPVNGTLTLDDEVPVATPAAVYALPGKHRAILSRDGKRLAFKEEMFEKGTVVTLREPEVAEVPAPVRPPPPPVFRTVHPYSVAYPLATLGVAAGFAVTTLVSYVRANDFYDNYTLAPADARGDISQSYERARTLGYVSLAVTLVLSAAGAGLGAYWFLGSKETREQSSRARLPFGVLAF